MNPTTYASLGAALASMDVSGVATRFHYLPETLNAADLPALYLEEFAGEESQITSKSYLGWPSFTARLIIVVIPLALGVRDGSWLKAVTMMDNLSEAIRDLAMGELAKGPVDLRVAINKNYQHGGTSYWAVEAEINAFG